MGVSKKTASILADGISSSETGGKTDSSPATSLSTLIPSVSTSTSMSSTLSV
ncbi:hypothetical protein HanRHA438_Chr10g0463271 [Helianthus annuus]|uniref:Uncharacterized protein n=1 Tax=Helianthus annuus TaxID=4232 RepID=A0A251TLR0_HELAN|nr:hypothetical protein HanXRQr2_Chr10g0450571 [Helianthus annuus]KAJ0530667.1 hypothetical protein HanHA89_Chr10g0392401 [Helianthus annuus]KAJ0880453.1 hypothetical protein HanRHA438_Chr10g0463271 [Helianthus annuus]KAJ0884536.1 hypothetical protein HanPSC8_Chr10g0434811 [Helianthus annuus]